MSIEPPAEVLSQPGDETPTRNCWRCGKTVDAVLPKCPYCAAVDRDFATVPSQSGDAIKPDRGVVHVLAAYAILLVISVITAVLVKLSYAGPREPSPGEVFQVTCVLEAIDTVAILAALVLIPMRGRIATRSITQKVSAWMLFMPVLVMLLALNFYYHLIVRSFAHLDLVESEMLKDQRLLVGWFIAACVQPAIIEELFFRYLALGALRSVMGVHGAVILSAVMFGMLHLGVPVSIPMLIVLGIGLGYARVYSGGMMLPIVLHFLHNVAALGLERMALGR